MVSKMCRIASMIVSCHLCVQFRCLGGDLFKRLFEWHLRVYAAGLDIGNPGPKGRTSCLPSLRTLESP
jgi:hypothetical protein